MSLVVAGVDCEAIAKAARRDRGQILAGHVSGADAGICAASTRVLDHAPAPAYTSKVTDAMVTPIESANVNSPSAERVDTAVSLLTAVADPVRWTVLQRLAESQSCVCNLQEHIPIASNLLSYHLKVLRDAGLVTTSRRGRWIDYSLAHDALDRLRAALPGGASLCQSKIGAPT